MAFNQIKTFFHPPVFAHENEKTRIASLLHTMLWSLAAVIFVLSVSSLIIGNIPLRGVIVIWVLFFILLGLQILMRHGRVTLAGKLLVFCISASTIVFFAVIGTARGPGVIYLVLASIIAGLILSRRDAVITAIINSLFVFAFIFAEAKGLLPQSSSPILFFQGIAFAVGAIITVILVNLATRSIDESLVLARRELTESALLRKREQVRREMLEKVIQLGKIVTEVKDLRTALWNIWNGIRNDLEFDRIGIWLYDIQSKSMQGAYGTDDSGNLFEAWHIKFELDSQALFHDVLSRPDGLYFTDNFEVERNLPAGHDMLGVKYYAAVAVWAGDKPVAIISADQLLSGRSISDEQLEALRLFAGYAGLAIENARLNSELEDRVKERENFIKELGVRNSELERFTYTVSHDLRSPLVTIRGFLGMLAKDLQDQQADRAAQDMNRISNAADKMDRLLSDLLQLSRVGHVVNPTEEIDLYKLTQETLETIDGRLRAKNIKVHISTDLPMIQGDRIRIREVLENLIDNAAKYMGDQSNPVIEVGTRAQEDGQVIFVKDNGLGIEPQYLKKVFGLFEKLNASSEGTGIGLALIKRIIEVHGGQAWVESDGLGKGSTFCFTIPNKLPKDMS